MMVTKRFYILYDGEKVTSNAIKRRVIPLAPTEGRGLKTSTPKYILQRLQKVLSQITAGKYLKNH